MNNNPEKNIFAEERKQMIVELVDENVKTTVAELCTRFSVSPATIRNDLRELEQSGLLKRTHGGAISSRRATFEPDAYEKAVERIGQKQAIAARAAAAYVTEGDTIALDTGTTAFAFARQLTGYRNLTVVTNDLQIASYLERSSRAHVIVAGGTVRRNFHCTVGPKALDTVANLNADKTFLCANGVSIKRGVTTPNVETADFKRMLAEIGDEVILLADSSKLDKTSFAKYADIGQIDVLVTDDEADADYLRQLRDKGVMVEICRAGNRNNKQR
jgi:DeoR family fructose operon transcriptional repressor